MSGTTRPARGEVSKRALLVVLVVQACDGRGCNEPPQSDKLPRAHELPAVAELPDPFRKRNGSRVRSVAEWPERRAEMKALLLSYAYGHLPPSPGPLAAELIERVPVFQGLAERRQVRLKLGPAQTITMILGLFVPRGRGPFPVILHVDHRGTFGISLAEEMARRGYLSVGYHPNLLDPDEPGVVGPAQAAYPDQDWGTLAVWAWGAMRAVDYLVSLPEVDDQRIAVTGHSRSGKTALLAGALDERIALVAPQGSGCAGAASYRFRQPDAESLRDITHNFPHWFVPGLRDFVGREQRLPFDQHFLLALVAPRPLLTIDAAGDRWANPHGTRASHLGALPVYEFLGAGGKLSMFIRPGGHLLADEDWRVLLDFADLHFFGRPSRTRFVPAAPLLGPPTHRWEAPRR